MLGRSWLQAFVHLRVTEYQISDVGHPDAGQPILKAFEDQALVVGQGGDVSPGSGVGGHGRELSQRL